MSAPYMGKYIAEEYGYSDQNKSARDRPKIGV